MAALQGHIHYLVTQRLILPYVSKTANTLACSATSYPSDYSGNELARN